MIMFFAVVVTLCLAVANGAHLPPTHIGAPHYGVKAGIPAEDMIAGVGYPSETHQVTTADGYILTVHRIPYGKQSPAAPNKPVVFLMHGILSSSVDWVVLGPGKSIAYMLADAGYDVWMGNGRGNTNSRKHVSLNPEKAEFWNFSWHEMGIHDLPAMIDYTLRITGASSLHYVGHSQGTTVFFIMASLRPEYNAKIRSMHALAPIAYMSHLTSPFVRLVALFTDVGEWILKFLGVNEFLPNSELIGMIGGAACKDEAITQSICSNFLFLIAGFNSQQMNVTILPTVLANIPAGSSTKQFIHFGQEINSAHFREFDYGWIQNLLKYKSLSPPDYPLEKITCPIALHYSGNDWMSHPTDVNLLAGRLPAGSLIGKFKVPDEKFNHLDYLFAIDLDTLVNNKVISLMDRY